MRARPAAAALLLVAARALLPALEARSAESAQARRERARQAATRVFPHPARGVRNRLIETMKAMGCDIRKKRPRFIVAEVPEERIPGPMLQRLPSNVKRYILNASIFPRGDDATRVELSFSMRGGSALSRRVSYGATHTDARHLYEAFWSQAKNHGLWEDPEAVAAVGRSITALRQGSAKQRAAAAKTLGRSSRDDAVAALVRALADRDLRVRAVAADSLGKTRNPKAVRPLLGLLSDKSPLLRALAARSLGTLGDESAIKRLKVLVEMEKNEKVLKEARKALKRLGGGSSDMKLDLDGMMKGMDLDVPLAPGP